EFRSPNAAYEAGAFQQALEGFLDLQVERPADVDLRMNLGSAQYRLGDFEAAAQSFAAAAANGDEAIRAEAYYNLGNTSYRRGQLEEAVHYYESSLDSGPEDDDTKFNLEFVRDEIRRRHEEAQKRQEEQQEQEQQDGEEQQSSDSQSGDEGQESEGSDDAQPQGGPDSDRDGLPDSVEKEGDNPTDPERPDSDGDGLLDGEEDRDRDGRVDPGETDPNRADSDGDGIPDSQEVRPGDDAGEPQGEASMSEAEAARFLDSLEEGRPRRNVPPGARRAVEKDW
ncbi:MAG: tetratricopeptide repeat protein, partial [Acidobacteriota bacterium]|nr:tetratricopeptide repeat protein [Acidobacteriota bacterium]